MVIQKSNIIRGDERDYSLFQQRLSPLSASGPEPRGRIPVFADRHRQAFASTRPECGGGAASG